MKEKKKFQLLFGKRSSILVLKKKRNIQLKGLNYYQKRSLKQRLMLDLFYFNSDN